MTFIRAAAVGAACLTMATAVQAGGLDDPIIEPELIVADTVSSGHDVLVPIVALILIATAVSVAD